MLRILLICLLLIPCGLFAEGRKMDSLSTREGKKYTNVEIVRIEDDSIVIRHEHGQARVPQEHLFYRLRKELGFFDKKEVPVELDLVEDDLVDESDASAPETAPGVSSLKECVACCLKVIVTEGLTENETEGQWSGSAFIVNEKGASYIYSNVHNFFGARNVYFEFPDGERIEEEDCGEIQVSTGKYGLHKVEGKKHGWGGDVIRIRLKQRRPVGLTLDRKVASSRLEGRKICVTGNSGGRGKITKLDGLITRVGRSDILHHNAKAEPGNSGSPMIDRETFKVLGVVTWGKVVSDPLRRIWERETEEEREEISSGASLARMRYRKSSFKALYQERLYLNRMKQAVRILGLLDTIYPTKGGLFVDSTKVVMGDYTVGHILNESPNHYVVKRLLALDKVLRERGKSNLGMSNPDMLKLYVAAYSDCLKYVSRQRKTIQNSIHTRSYFFQCAARNSYVLEICKVYEGTLEMTLKWYQRQRGAAGEGLPLGRRLRLPNFRSGIEAIGIQAE